MSILSDIEAFCGTHELSEWQFGEKALNDRHFIRQLREGRRTWPETEAKVRRFMATYRPDTPTESAAA